MEIMRFYWEPPCHHHDFERPYPVMFMLSPVFHMPAIIIHPDMDINSLGCWQQRWIVPNSRIWSNGGIYKVDDFVRYFLDIKELGDKYLLRRIKNNIKSNSMVYMDNTVNRLRFVATGEFCIANNQNHDVLIKIPPAYSF